MSFSKDENRMIGAVASVVLAPLFCGLMGFVAGPVMMAPGTDLAGPEGVRQALVGAGVGLIIGIAFAIASVYRLMTLSSNEDEAPKDGPAH
jgi:hypothetical protein